MQPAIVKGWNKMVKRGEIYWVEFDPVKGSEQGGLLPPRGASALKPIGKLSAETMRAVDVALAYNLGL
jgi:mRNA-degrading endonuclease toxin of MazEF toxin-antitoxin module